jgi:hypothetical protein
MQIGIIEGRFVRQYVVEGCAFYVDLLNRGRNTLTSRVRGFLLWRDLMF